jgi:uncharacterized membrane protein
MFAIGPTELLLISIICIPTVLLASGAIMLFFLLVRRSQGNPVTRQAPLVGTNDIAHRLHRLQELRQAGTISEEEYERKKASILADL